VLAEKAMAEEQAKINKHGSFILEYKDEDIISTELLRKEAVRTNHYITLFLSLCVSVCLCVCVSLCVWSCQWNIISV